MKQKIYPIIEEEWYPVSLEKVPDGYYFVSNVGRVKNANGKIIKPDAINSGYLVYRLWNRNPNATTFKERYTRILAHRLVMETIHPVDGMENLIVNHKNHNKTSNYDANLEWVTNSENVIDSLEYNKTYGEKRKDTKFTNSQLKIIDNEIKKGTAYKDILKLIGMEDTWNNRDLIGNIKRGITYQRALKDIRNE